MLRYLLVMVIVVFGVNSAWATDIVRIDIGTNVQTNDWKTVNIGGKKVDPMVFTTRDGIYAYLSLAYSKGADRVVIKSTLFDGSNVQLKSWTNELAPHGANWTTFWSMFTITDRLDVGHYQIRFKVTDLNLAGSEIESHEEIHNFDVTLSPAASIIAQTGTTLVFEKLAILRLALMTGLKSTHILHTIYNLSVVGAKHSQVLTRYYKPDGITLYRATNSPVYDHPDDAHNWTSYVTDGKFVAGTYIRRIYVNTWDDPAVKKQVRPVGDVDTTIVIAP